jgi:cell wall-associated NlpC family hydrolase
MTTKLQVFLLVLEKHWGKPYIWGGDDPILGVDCSGLILEGFKSCGMVSNTFDTTAKGIHDLVVKSGGVYVKKEDALPGDLVFCGSSLGSITHIQGVLMPRFVIEAGGGGSASTSAEKAAAINAYVRIRPLGNRSDIVAIVRPKWD